MVFKTKSAKNIRIEISEEEILKRIQQIEQFDIDDDFRQFLIQALEALICLDKIIGMKETTILKLRKIFNKQTERRNPSSDENKPPDTTGDAPVHPRGNNNGKNGADSYEGAKQVEHKLSDVKSGEICPECKKGKLYDYTPGVYIRITGSAPLSATIHKTQKVRCNACLKIFEADFEGQDAPKYDEKAKAIVALLKYRASMPFYRLEKIQKQLMVPMPASTQWDLMEDLINDIWPVWEELLKIAPQGELFHQDDTTGKVLALIKENKTIVDKKTRKGIFTSCIISKLPDEKKITLFFTGRKHSGENLSELLSDYQGIIPPTVMSDALSSNNIKNIKILQALCLAHGRRKFFDLGNYAQQEADYVLDLIKLVYAADHEAKEQKLSPEERLKLHQEKSTQPMADLKLWCEKAFEDKIVEPNSTLGKAINYILKHWEGLTCFLRIAGAPLDNNVLERELRLAVINRKNWYFYKTMMGALVGDVMLSIIKTCEQNGVSSFDYLVWAQQNKQEMKMNPSLFLPWNYSQKI